MGVFVAVFESGFVEVLMRVRPITMSMLMHNMLVIMAGMGVVVRLLAVSVLVIVRCFVVMFCRHLLTSFSLGLCAVKVDSERPIPSAAT